MKTLLGLLLFLALPLLIAEPFIRYTHRNLYQRFEDRLAAGPVDVVLVGSSRVAAALDETVLSAALSPVGPPATAGGRPRAVINLGRGYSRPQDKFLLLRTLLNASPASLRGAWLLIEAPVGVPDPADWTSPWAVSQEPGLIAPYLTLGDVWRMARESSTPHTLQAEVALYRVSRAALALRKSRDALDLALAAWNPVAPAETSIAALAAAPMAAAGGVRNDPATIAAARAQVTESAPSPTVPRNGVLEAPPFDRTVWSDVVQLAQDHGMHVAFFDPPMCTADRLSALHGYPTGLPQQRARELAARSLPLLPPAAQPPDSAYPDLLHLDEAHRAEYSRAFAAALREALGHAL